MAEDATIAAPETRLAAPFDRLTIVWLKTAACLSVGFVYAWRVKQGGAETFFFWNQDLPVLGLMVVFTAALALAPTRGLARLRLAWSPLAWVYGLAAVGAAAGVLGARWLFGGYTLSLDEFMANFDARIFASGRLMAPVAPQWQPFVPALQPLFTLPLPTHALWASAYLPVNAGLRAAALRVGAEAWVNPLLSGFSVVALYRIGQRLWPGEPRIGLIAAGLMGTSAQLILMSMTAYAMSAHLAFNLAWLWLFLRGGRLGHAGALLVGLLATGLHQLVFHPLFAAPFVLQLWLDRRWRLAALYTLGYAAIGLFWTEYWRLAMHLAGVPEAGPGQFGGGWLLDRLVLLVSAIRFDNLGEMGQTVMRFVTWQNPLTAPLALAGTIAATRAKGHLRALVLGVVLTLVAMLILEPTQVHGWGYRYLHGLLGSVALIAAWSWVRLTAALAPARRDVAGGGLILACAVSLLALTPLRAWQAWRYVAPYAAANARIQAATAPVVIVDHEGSPGFDPGTVVRNDPLLLAGPKVMQLSYLDAGMVRTVCAGGDVQVFDGRDAARLGIDTEDVPLDPQVPALRALMKELHCGQPMP